jgi:hypothetical protein
MAVYKSKGIILFTYFYGRRSPLLLLRTERPEIAQAAVPFLP